MAFPIGDGRINPNPCADVPEEMQGWYAEVGDTINNLTIIVNEAGIVDTYQFKETELGTAGFWDEKVLGEGEYDGGVHQQVFYQIIDNQVFMFTVAGGGSGGGDTYKVKVASGGTEGFLDTKIHADTWEPTDTYNSGMHFQVLAANVADSVRFYAPYAIIKNSAGDSAPGYLASKFANAEVYSSSSHILASFQDLGSTIRHFVPKSAINVLIEAYVALGLFVEVVAVTDAIAAPTWTAATGKLTPTDCEFPVFYEHADDDGTWTIDEATTTTFQSWLDVDITAPATGKYRRALVVGSKLTVIQCTEQDLPTGWGA